MHSAQPACSTYPGFLAWAPLLQSPGQLGTMSPSLILEATRSSFQLVTWAQAGWADTTPPGASPTSQLAWPLLSGS